MDSELVVLRILHILPGVFWVGGTLFAALILEPALARLGPDVQRPVMQALGRVMGPALTGAALVTIVFGFALVSRTPGHGFAELFRSGWGQAIGIGMVAALLAFAIGLVTAPTAMAMGRLSARAQAGGGSPGPEILAEIRSKAARLRLSTRVSAVLAVVSVGAMAAADYV